MAMVKRFDILLINLDPTQGSEIKKTRPYVVISPNEMNQYIRTLIVAPMTSKSKGYPTRVALNFEGKAGEVVLDQVRTIDKSRVVKKLGHLESKTANTILQILQEVFS